MIQVPLLSQIVRKLTDKSPVVTPAYESGSIATSLPGLSKPLISMANRLKQSNQVPPDRWIPAFACLTNFTEKNNFPFQVLIQINATN